MPAPAVIPALLAYIEVDAVKKFVVEIMKGGRKWWSKMKVLFCNHPSLLMKNRVKLIFHFIYFEEIRVFITVIFK